jgi:hypothetical protein
MTDDSRSIFGPVDRYLAALRPNKDRKLLRTTESRGQKLRLAAPYRGFATAVLACMCAASLPAYAQPKGKADKADKGSSRSEPAAKAAPDKADKKPKEKTFDFNNLKLSGQLRTPQLLYFLERANEELERASLEKRSFIPHIVRSLEDEAL